MPSEERISEISQVYSCNQTSNLRVYTVSVPGVPNGNYDMSVEGMNDTIRVNVRNGIVFGVKVPRALTLSTGDTVAMLRRG